MSTRHHWWPRVSLSKIITFMWRSYMNMRKTDKEWAGFQPLDEQLGTSLGMSAEYPAAIPSVGEHEVQHESTVCWEFAPFLWTSSCLPQLSADAACERSNRTGQNNTPRNQNRWEKKWPPQRGLQHWFIQKSSNWIQPVHPDSCQCFINHNRIHGWITEWAHRAQAQGHKGSRGHLVLCLMWLCCEEKKETPTKRC